MKIKKVQIREDDGFLVNDVIGVPNDKGNRHYVMIQEWIDAGNTPTHGCSTAYFEKNLFRHTFLTWCLGSYKRSALLRSLPTATMSH